MLKKNQKNKIMAGTGIGEATSKLQYLQNLLRTVNLKLELVVIEPFPKDDLVSYKASINLTKGSCWFDPSKNLWVKKINVYRTTSVVVQAYNLLINDKSIVHVITEENYKIGYKEFQFNGQTFIQTGSGMKHSQ